jgi:hypothetical protein
MTWFLRSLADRDTHCGDYSIVTRSVHAVCGIEFVPTELPLGGPALPGTRRTPSRSARRARGALGDPFGALGALAGVDGTEVRRVVLPLDAHDDHRNRAHPCPGR